MNVFGLIAECNGFQWDASNLLKVAQRHSVSQEECEQAFLIRPFRAMVNDVHSTVEKRYWLMGVTKSGRKLHIVFTIRGELIRVLSARDMSRRERRLYGK